MNLSKIKLVVTHMDGTLLNDRKEISPRFFPLLEQLKEHEIHFAVASGRQYYSLRDLFDKVKEDMLFIAENGALIVKNEEYIHSEPIDSQMVWEVVRALKDRGEKYIILCDAETAYTEHSDPLFLETMRENYSNYKIVRTLEELTAHDIWNITICNFSGAEQHTMPHIEHLKDDLQVKLSGDIWVDITHKQAHKGNALQQIQKKLNVSSEETMVFGDYLNDLDLFDYATFSFAMENAHEAVKQKARFITESNEEEGVVKVLEKLVQQRAVCT